MDKRSFSDKFWKDKYGRTVVWQRPNLLIIVWAITAFFALFLELGTVERIFYYISYTLLMIWALLEIFQGANYFRRLLGISVLLLVIVIVLFG
jgi:hypothetical protein